MHHRLHVIHTRCSTVKLVRDLQHLSFMQTRHFVEENTFATQARALGFNHTSLSNNNTRHVLLVVTAQRYASKVKMGHLGLGSGPQHLAL